MGNFYMESTQINYRRDDKLKTVDQKLQELSETSAIDTDIAPVFKSTNTYQPGDMVYYRNKLYVFNVEHTGTWAAADVTATDVTTTMNAGLASLKSGLTNLADVPIYTTDSALISAFRGKHDYYRTFVMSDSTKTMALLNEINEVSVYVVFFENQQMWGNHPNFYAFIQDSVWVGVLNIGENSVTVSACSKLAKNSELIANKIVGTYRVNGIFQNTALYSQSYGIAFLGGFDPAVHSVTINSAKTLDGTSVTLVYNSHTSQIGSIGFYEATTDLLGKIVDINVTISKT